MVAGDVTQPLLGLDPEVLCRARPPSLPRRARGGERPLRRVARRPAPDERGRDRERSRRSPGRSTPTTDSQRVLHVSTAYVAGRRTARSARTTSATGFGFDNDYERTKYEAERLVRRGDGSAGDRGSPRHEFVGDSRPARSTTFNTFYVLLRRYLTRRPHLVPVEPTAAGEHRAGRLRRRRSVTAADRPTRRGMDRPPDGAAGIAPDRRRAHPRDPIVGAGRARRAAPPTILVPLPRVRVPGVPATRLRILMPYLHERRTFRRDDADRLLGPYELRWRAYPPALIRFAVVADSSTAPDGPSTSRRCSGCGAGASRSTTSTSWTADVTRGRRPTYGPTCWRRRGPPRGGSAAGTRSRPWGRTAPGTSRSRSRWVSSVPCRCRCTPRCRATRSTRSYERATRTCCWSGAPHPRRPRSGRRDPADRVVLPGAPPRGDPVLGRL